MTARRTTNMPKKTPRELMAQCAEQLSADGHHELSLEIAELKAAQPAPAAPYQVPDGWQLVPVEPTKEMCRALFINLVHADDEAKVIRAVIAAAPKAAA